VIADLDTLLTALYVELTDRIIPSLGRCRSRCSGTERRRSARPAAPAQVPPTEIRTAIVTPTVSVCRRHSSSAACNAVASLGSTAAWLVAVCGGRLVPVVGADGAWVHEAAQHRQHRERAQPEGPSPLAHPVTSVPLGRVAPRWWSGKKIPAAGLCMAIMSPERGELL
jgi:hypothetical protein